MGVDGDDIADLWVGAAGQNPSEAVPCEWVHCELQRHDWQRIRARHVSIGIVFKISSDQQGCLRWHITVGMLGDINGDKYVDVVAHFLGIQSMRMGIRTVWRPSFGWRRMKYTWAVLLGLSSIGCVPQSAPLLDARWALA